MAPEIRERSIAKLGLRQNTNIASSLFEMRRTFFVVVLLESDFDFLVPLKMLKLRLIYSF